MTGQKKKLDLSALDTVKACNTPYKLELTHPVTKEPLGQFVMIYGKDSDIFRDYNDEKFNEAIRKAAENGRRGLTEKPQTSEERRKNRIELLVACTAGFEAVEFNGPLEFTHSNANKLYSSLPWICDQIDAAIFELGNFMNR